ncbi:hypothetical protein D915_005842 [Fasciola hepatica]|uniref:Glycoprotein-N-acetylgalactosamine 3-beta-galactosyltransferase 1 n=1 Tax=Fasciola hepatica TaxID=6192 RepID=A0A4E0RXR9_FASHE|nr:hypothetical protein D915_005842 [Fasciola hepatica]
MEYCRLTCRSTKLRNINRGVLHVFERSPKRIFLMNAVLARVRWRDMCIILCGMITMKIILIACGGVNFKPTERITLHTGTAPVKSITSGELPQLERPRIYCILLTNKPNYELKAIHVQNSWARRCTEFSFASDKKHPHLHLLDFKLTKRDTYDNLWAKMTDVYRRRRRHFFIYENLEGLLQSFPSNRSIHLGYLMGDRVNSLFYSGGGGYILSRRALKDIVERGLGFNEKSRKCNTIQGPEDTLLAACAQLVGVAQYDCRDVNRTDIFSNRSPDTLFEHLRFTAPKLLKYSTHWDHFSENQVTTHYVEPAMNYVMEFLVYHVGQLLKQNLLQIPTVYSSKANFICERTYLQRAN